MNQPDAYIYSLIYLIPHTVRVFDSQAAYIAATGLIPPGFNPGLPPQYWYDTAADANALEIDYTKAVIDPSGEKVIVSPMPLAGARAATVNIPPPNYTKASSLPVTPIPIRDLYSSERLVIGPCNTINVIRTDRPAVQSFDRIMIETLGVVASRAMGLLR